MKPAIKIAVIYLIFGILWILLSDRIVLLFFSHGQLENMVYFQTLKGVFYIVLTACLLYLLVKQYYKSLNDKLTELNAVNEELKLRSRSLEVSNEQLEQFAYVASHDLQEPLRMITVFLNQLEKRYSDVIDDKGQKYIFFAVNGAERMRNIILDLLEFSRIGRIEGAKEQVDLNLVVKDIEQVFSRDIQKKTGTVTCSILPVITTYKTFIEHIFQNLISNAIKYSSDSNNLEIIINCKDDAEYWHFSVSDNGIGISKEYFDKIFIIFQRLHAADEYDGTGIGLSITKKLIECLGGKIWVESELNQGTIFYFTIKK